MKGSISSSTFILSMVILACTVCIGFIPSVGHGLILVLVSLLSILFSLIVPDGLFLSLHDRIRYALIWCLVILFCLISMIYISHISTVHVVFPKETINAVSGKVLFDSSFSEAGNHIMTINLRSADTVFGQSGTAGGLITAVGKQKAIITSGIKVRLTGHFSDGNLFIYDSLQIMKRNMLNDIREFIIPRLEKRTGNPLSTMLILGRADTFDSSVKELASSCGCMHVLALSGMHLHAVTAPAGLIKNKYLKYTAKAFLVAVFLFIAGPRSSLVRSAVFIMLSFLPIYERLVMTFIIQILVFPLSLVGIGSVYGYISVFALLLTAPLITPFLSFFTGKTVGNALGSSLSVLCVIAPIQLFSTGTWKPISIIAGPVASVLAALSMAFGFAEVLPGNWRPVVFLNNCVYEIMLKTLTFFSQFKDGGIPEYYVLLFMFSAVILCSVVFRHHLQSSIVHNAKIR